MSDWDLRPYQQEILRIFLEYTKICKKYNLSYFAIGGTALGAVRHKGFIPWDDDFDVAMPREDFNKFVRVVGSELPQCMRFIRGGTERRSPIYYGKILNYEKGLLDKLVKEMRVTTDREPSIDIFVLDGLPMCVTDVKKWWLGRRLLRLCQLYRFPESATSSQIASGKKSFILYLVCRIAGCFISLFYPRTKDNDSMMLMYDTYAMRWPYKTSKAVAEIAFFRMRTDRIFHRNIFGEGRVVPFEDVTIQIPELAEQYLAQMYGKWKELPPEEYRIPEHLLHTAYNHV